MVSASSEPSGHSSSPSHFHRSGMQWPLPQVKSLSAQVFLAVGQGEECECPGGPRRFFSDTVRWHQGDQDVFCPRAGPHDLPSPPRPRSASPTKRGQERSARSFPRASAEHQVEAGGPWPCLQVQELGSNKGDRIHPPRDCSFPSYSSSPKVQLHCHPPPPRKFSPSLMSVTLISLASSQPL